MASTTALWDINLFKNTINVVGIKIPCQKTSAYISKLNPFLLRQRNTKPIQALSDAQRLILLDPSNVPTLESVQSISPEFSQMMKDDKAELEFQKLEIDYESYTLDEALRVILPPDIPEIPTSFEIVGHVAHLNLKARLLPFKHAIGQMIIDKTSGIRTVVNKVETIQNQFRVFPMEILAGEDNLDVEVIQSNCKFRFNFSKVYWNSRLQTEHERIINICKSRKPAPIICDVFAGVGPFSIPLAKQNCTVYANDLNPASYNYLVENAKLNKCRPNRHFAFNLDGREFVRTLIVDKKVRPTDVIMNLPASAIEFLDVFKGLYPPNEKNLPTIHCYSFSEADNLDSEVIQKIEAVIGAKLENPLVHNVRNVAPKKWMVCTSFSLPQSMSQDTPTFKKSNQTTPEKNQANDQQEKSSPNEKYNESDSPAGRREGSPPPTKKKKLSSDE